MRKIAGIRCFSARSDEEVRELVRSAVDRLLDALPLLLRGEVGAEEEDLQIAILVERVGELAELRADLVDLVLFFGDAEQGVAVYTRDLFH